ncbi:unnamed protein product [Linum tenue]|uniref:Uncharacterized protein n=1 Tax=Linum tenue TaxID=586396 RepID=A0AAV0H045_9ROSI|nr:unnamed protein product [Linum tenue]
MAAAANVVAGGEVRRKRVEFHPSVWNDFFARPDNHSPVISGWREDAEQLKEEVREMLKGAAVAATERNKTNLEMIDAVQRLGIDYHFEHEIEAALLQISGDGPVDDDTDDDLYTVSLRFRLLRQQGYHINPTLVLRKFTDEKGSFKQDLKNDVRGLLSLYEAAYYRINGEQILDEALEFARTHLEPISQLDSPLGNQVKHSLKWPILKGLPIRESKHFMSIYQQDQTHNEAILKLGKLDFNLVQKLHQHELMILTKWWMDLDTETTLPFARDRVIEGYMWPLGGFLKPDYTVGRIFVTKITQLIAVLDDIFDVHGTLDELECVVKVIERWEINDEDDKVPDYFEFWFKTLLGVFAEIEAHVSSEGRLFCMDYVREAVKQIVRAFIKEARWYGAGYVATMEENLPNGYTSIGYPMAVTVSYCGMGEVASEEIFKWLSSQPKILVAGSTIARLMDDIVSHEFEQERGHVASSVECYIKQYGVSKDEAHLELNKLVEKLWKDMNEELLQPLEAPMPILKTIFNMVRVMDLLYKDKDTYTDSKTVMKELLTYILVDPVAL